MALSAEISAVDPFLPSEHALRIPCYCEENVWRLAYRRTRLQVLDTDDTATAVEYHVVFISNKYRCCPMYYQKSSEGTSSPCFWDYHVILLVTTTILTPVDDTSNLENETMTTKTITHVLDLDSLLPYPCPVSLYLKETFNYSMFEDETILAPSFRLIPASTFLKYFYSDRMHMFDRKKQIWSSPPPSYECIMHGRQENNGTSSASNLDRYVNMDGGEETIYGCVMSLDEIKQKFC
jgi:hypothetical protein